MTKPNAVYALLRDHLHDPGTQWNLGTFGAIAEFMRDPDERFEIFDLGDRLSATTDRGGIGFDDLRGVRPFASESATGANWNHRVALCLPADTCAMARRTVLTELGPDDAPLRESDRGAILFDMGLGVIQADICIRTSDRALIAVLRAEAGRSLFAAGNSAMGAIVAAGPHRVFKARLGRCEVYQPIPPADGRSPEGPHTHVLPQLLKTGRTHAANEMVPRGFVPCAHLVPAHPIKDGMGHARSYDREAASAFDDLLDRYGDPQQVAIKRAVRQRLSTGDGPSGFASPSTRFGRHALRVALRQERARGQVDVRAWLAAFDPREGQDGDAEQDAYGHD